MSRFNCDPATRQANFDNYDEGANSRPFGGAGFGPRFGFGMHGWGAPKFSGRPSGFGQFGGHRHRHGGHGHGHSHGQEDWNQLDNMIVGLEKVQEFLGEKQARISAKLQELRAEQARRNESRPTESKPQSGNVDSDLL